MLTHHMQTIVSNTLTCLSVVGMSGVYLKVCVGSVSVERPFDVVALGFGGVERDVDETL